MKVLHISFSDEIGGASKAALRLVKAQREIGINAELMVVKKKSEYDFVITSKRIARNRSLFFRASLRLIKHIYSFMNRCYKIPVSLNLLYSNLSYCINKSDYDLVNLHWVGNETLSLFDIARIKKPVIWTFHDMWAFLGAEHYSVDRKYSSIKYFLSECISNFIKFIKKTHLKNINHVVTPSNWLMDASMRSDIFCNTPHTVIPNCIDVSIFHKRESKKSMHFVTTGLPIILYGAVGGTKNHVKGFDLLLSSLTLLDEKNINYQCIVFGEEENELIENSNIKKIGYIFDQIQLSELYNLADVFVLPSRMENLPQVAIEAQLCGLPVVAYNIGGMSDIISNGITGFLIKPFDVNEFARCIQLIIENQEMKKTMSNSAAKTSKERFNERCIADQYRNLYSQYAKY